jgi:hypothetical protein
MRDLPAASPASNPLRLRAAGTGTRTIARQRRAIKTTTIKTT